MVWGPTNRNDNRNRPDNGPDNATTPGAQNTPQAPTAPGGGGLTNPLFSGDHVLENVAKGNGLLREGARGPAVRAIQNFLISQGQDLGASGADGSWGRMTTTALKAWQKANGLKDDAIIGKGTLGKMDTTTGTVTPGGGGAAPPGPSSSEPGGGLPVDFEKVWAAHPHNYQDDWEKNTSSADLQKAQGWDADQYSNTCAIRMSVMFNKLGGDYALSRTKAKQAGLDPRRLPYSRKTGWYYILSAKEMWIYMSYWAGKPHAEYPARGRYKDAGEFNKGFDSEIRDEISGKKGIVAFDKIFGYSGTGHVDIFDGQKLSDANEWYPSQALKLWYI